MKKSPLFFAAALAAVFGFSEASAQATGDLQTKQSGPWTSQSTWQYYDGAVWQDVNSNAQLPTSTRDVTIKNGHIVNGPGSSVAVKNLTIETDAKLFANNSNFSSSSFEIDLYGNATIDGKLGNGSGLDATVLDIYGADVTISGSGRCDIKAIKKKNNANNSNLTLKMGVVLRNSGSYTIFNEGNKTFNITVEQYKVLDVFGENPSLGASKSGDLLLDAPANSGATHLMIKGLVRVTGEAILATNNASSAPIAISIYSGGEMRTAALKFGSVSNADAHSFSMQVGSMLNLTGANPIASPSTTNHIINADGCKVLYMRNGNQTINLPFAPNLLMIGGSGVKSLTSDITVNGTFDFLGTATFDAGSNDLFYGAGSKIWYRSSVAHTIGDEWNTSTNLKTIWLENSNGITLDANRTFTGVIELRQGGFNASSADFTIGDATIVRLNNNTKFNFTPVFENGANISLIYNSNVAAPIETGTEVPGVNQTLVDVIINNASGVKLMSDIVIANKLVLNNGNFVMTGRSVTLEGTLATGSGNFYCNNQSKLIVKGSGNLGGALNFASGGMDLNTLTIERATLGSTKGTVNLGSGISLKFLNLNNGFLQLNNNDLTLDPLASVSNRQVSGGNQNSFIRTNGSGRFILALFDNNDNTVSTANYTTIFPVGFGNTYLPVTLTNGDEQAYVAVRVKAGSVSNALPFVHEVYNVRDNNDANATISFEWMFEAEGAGFDRNTAYITSRELGGLWSAVTSSASILSSPYSVTSDNDFTFTKANAPGASDPQSVKYEFAVTSISGGSFVMEAKASEELATQENQPLETIYTEEGVLETTTAPSFGLNVFPNPAVNVINLTWNSNSNNAAVIAVVDINGRVMMQQRVGTQTGAVSHNLNVEALAAGTYFVNIATIEGNMHKTFIKK